MATANITMYMTAWCGDCRVAKRVFAEHGIPYTAIDIEQDDNARAEVLRINGGRRTVPTILLPSGAVSIEPTARELEAALRAEGLIT